MVHKRPARRRVLWGMLHGQVVVLAGTGKLRQHARGILRLIQVGQCLVVGTTCEAPTPKLWSLDNERLNNGTALFHGCAVMTLVLKKKNDCSIYLVRDDLKAFFRLCLAGGEKWASAKLGYIDMYDTYLEKSGKWRKGAVTLRVWCARKRGVGQHSKPS